VAWNLKQFVNGLHYAMRRVAPEIFIRHFRPYFEPITIIGSEYRGPGAVTMPLHILDFLMWGSSETDPRYRQFTLDYIPYNTGEFRTYYYRALNTPSLLDRLEQGTIAKYSTAGDERYHLRDALLVQVAVCLNRVRSFRNAHLKYANQAYHGVTAHSFESGSGGHTTADLDWLARLTAKHSDRLARLMRLHRNCQEPSSSVPI
jgi:hypothetical protein